MKWDRRTFLQTLLIWGVAQESLTRLHPNQPLKKYYQTLAEPTHRKLALLVGINNYGPKFNLEGCVTDVERQKDLLIHRFGFNSQDILTLTDDGAGRQNIENAFVEHLIFLHVNYFPTQEGHSLNTVKSVTSIITLMHTWA